MEKKKLTKKDKIVYALIVLMGVAAFIISTIWLCKTEEAEAAIMDVPDYRTEVAGLVDSQKALVDNYKYLIVFYDNWGNAFYRYVFVNEIKFSDKGVLTSNGSVVSVWAGSNTYGSQADYNSSYGYSASYVVASNVNLSEYYDGFSSLEYTIINYPYIPLPDQYQGNLYSDIWYFQKNEPYHVSYADRKISVMFNICGDVPEYAALHPEDSFRLKTDFTYYLPAPSYVKNWILNGKKPEELLLPVNRKDFEANYTSPSMGVSFRGGLDCDVSKEVVPTTGEIRYRIDPLESLIHDSAAQIAGIDWQSYYGLTDSEWSIYKDVIFGYSVFTKLSTVLYAKDTASSYVYGGLYTVSVLEVDNFLDTYIDKEFSEVTEAEQERAEKDRLSELLGTQDGTIEDLKQQIKDMQDTQNALGGDLQGTDLWSGFSTLSKGLSSLGPALSAISSIVGSVLSFVPAPITSTMGFTFLAICIVALIKAIK